MHPVKTIYPTWPRACTWFSAALCVTALAQAPESAPTVAATAPMTVLQANSVLGKKLPGFTASSEEANAFWAERLKASIVMFDGEEAARALTKVATLESDPVVRLKVYDDVVDLFRKKGRTNDAMRIEIGRAHV